jgi:hypothetical protein
VGRGWPEGIGAGMGGPGGGRPGKRRSAKGDAREAIPARAGGESLVADVGRKRKRPRSRSVPLERTGTRGRFQGPSSELERVPLHASERVLGIGLCFQATIQSATQTTEMDPEFQIL